MDDFRIGNGGLKVVLTSSDLFEVFFASLAVHKEIEHFLTKQVLKLGLTLVELQVLWVVTVSGETVMTDLALLVSRSKNELQAVVHSLEADELIIKVSNSDSRFFVLKATSKGENLLAEIQRAIEVDRLTKRVDSKLTRDYIRSARRLVRAFRGNQNVDFAPKSEPSESRDFDL